MLTLQVSTCEELLPYRQHGYSTSRGSYCWGQRVSHTDRTPQQSSKRQFFHPYTKARSTNLLLLPPRYVRCTFVGEVHALDAVAVLLIRRSAAAVLSSRAPLQPPALEQYDCWVPV